MKTLRGQCTNGEWSKTSSANQKDYYLKYLPYHLHSSKQSNELVQLFFDFSWLEQKVKQTNLPSLISDFRFLDTPLEDIKLLKSSLMLSGHAIEKNPDSIGPQLLGNKTYVLYFILRYLVYFNFAYVTFSNVVLANTSYFIPRTLLSICTTIILYVIFYYMC